MEQQQQEQSHFRQVLEKKEERKPFVLTHTHSRSISEFIVEAAKILTISSLSRHPLEIEDGKQRLPRRDPTNDSHFFHAETDRKRKWFSSDNFLPFSCPFSFFLFPRDNRSNRKVKKTLYMTSSAVFSPCGKVTSL